MYDTNKALRAYGLRTHVWRMKMHYLVFTMTGFRSILTYNYGVAIQGIYKDPVSPSVYCNVTYYTSNE